MATRSAKLGGSAGGAMDYLQDKERTFEYYGEGDGFTTVWGKLAPTLGVERGISRDQWTELFEGKWNGETVTRSGHRQVVNKDTGEVETVAARTPAIDIFFAVPKGVSELYARAATQAEADAIGRIVLASAGVAWKEGVEDHARVARVRVDDGTPGIHAQERLTADLLCTPVLQFTARPTDATTDRNAPADPHLHVHATTLTAAQVDGRWYTIDEAGIKRTAEYRDQLFMGELSRRLEEAGYKLDHTNFDRSRSGRTTFEPASSNAKLRKFWSSNHERSIDLARQFEAKYERPPTDDELNRMMTVSRGKKADKEMDARPTRERWLSDAREAGFDPHLLSPSGVHIKPTEERLAELEARLMGPSGLVRDDAVFYEEAVKVAVARCAVGLHFTRDELKDYEVGLRDRLIVVRPAVDASARLLTTDVHLAKEKLIADRSYLLHNRPRVPLSREAVAHAVRSSAHELDDEQLAAVASACHTSAWVNITGNAGSGKSTVARTIVEAHRIAGSADQVVATAVAAKTANDFGRKVRADAWGSVESLLMQIERGKLTPTDKTLWLIDEAAMVDTHRMATLLEAVGNGRVVLIGDDKQLSAIGASGWYAENLETFGSVHLTRVFRQEEARDIETYNLLRDANGSEAVRRLVEDGRVHVASDDSARLGLLMNDYRSLRDAGVSPSEVRVVIETSNHDVDLVNRFVQRDRIVRGEVTGKGFTVGDEEQGRRWTIHAGDQVILLQPYFARGAAPIRNGTTGEVLALDEVGRARIRFDDGTVTTMALTETLQTQPLGLAYAQHQTKMQGCEADHILALPSPDRTSANSGYSVLTRARRDAHVYLSEPAGGDLASTVGNNRPPTRSGVLRAHDALANGWSREDPSVTAGSYQEKAPVGARHAYGRFESYWSVGVPGIHPQDFPQVAHRLSPGVSPDSMVDLRLREEREEQPSPYAALMDRDQNLTPMTTASREFAEDELLTKDFAGSYARQASEHLERADADYTRFV